MICAVLLMSCVTTWQAKKSIKVGFAGGEVDCHFTVFYEKGMPLKTVDVCQFEVVVFDQVYKCLVKAPTVGKQVDLETDCSVLWEKSSN